MTKNIATSPLNSSIVPATMQDHRSKLAVILHADVCDSADLLHQHEVLAHTRIKESFKRFGAVVSPYNGQVGELRGEQ